MFWQLFTAVWLWFSVFGQAPSGHVGCWAAGPIIERMFSMDQDNKVPATPEPTPPAAMPTPTPAAMPTPTPAATPPPTPEATPPPTVEPTPPAPKTRTVTVKLRDLPNPADFLDEFAFRVREKYTKASLADMIESVKLFGVLEAPHIVKGPDGKWIEITGHRRIAALHVLAKAGVAGFSLDMDVTCVEVLDSSRAALMARSMSSNETSLKLDPTERLEGVLKMDQAGATKREIAVAAKLSEKQIARDLTVVRNPRVFQHVKDGNLPPSDAPKIVEVAKGRLNEFLDHFDGCVLEMMDKIEEEDRLAKQERGKGLRPNQMIVANRLEAHVLRGWLDQLAKGKPLTEEKDLGFQATFDKKTNVATIKVKVDATNDPVEYVSRIAGQISQVARRLAAVAQKRSVIEAPMGAQAMLQEDDGFLDRDLLAQFGLEGVIDLEPDVPAEDNQSAEPTPEDTTNDATSGPN